MAGYWGVPRTLQVVVDCWAGTCYKWTNYFLYRPMLMSDGGWSIDIENAWLALFKVLGKAKLLIA